MWPFLERAVGRGRRRVVMVGVLLAAAVVPMALASRAHRPETVAVSRGDLVLTVEVEGEVRAARSKEIGPPVVRDVWEYKITFLAPEGAAVKAGDSLVSFDASPLKRALDEKRTEADESAKRIERKELEVEAQRRDLELQLAEADSRLVKARLKNDVPEELRSRNEVRQTALELGQAEEETRTLRARIAALHTSAAASLEALSGQRDRARARVAELEAAIAAMTVRAPQDGIVIYRTGWRDEKKKVGDSIWFGQKLLQLPDLGELYAEGEVDEADAGKVAVGQRVRLRIEALPDQDLSGSVSGIGRTVRRKSPRVPSKVARVRIAFDQKVPALRPSMRFRGEIETARLPAVLTVPCEAVAPRPSGPVVWRLGFTGFREAPVRVGRRGRRQVEVLAGVAEGDRVATTDLGAAADP